MSFPNTGAERIENALTEAELARLAELADRHLGDNPGTRIVGDDLLSAVLAPGGAMDRIARAKLGDDARPVRAILFDKRDGANWALAWHQDRTIAVRKRIDHPGFGPWSRKGGIQHVEPPFEIIASMVTLRAHLDRCEESNAPLLIAPGSHQLGRIPVDRISAVVEQLGTAICLAETGDVWAYATAIVHASDAAEKPARRRVLHVDYANISLPGELEWLGI
jgi:hypothetical protein